MNKITDGLEDALKSAKCAHVFDYLKAFPMGNGVVGRCRHCRCRFTAWPGTAHYEEIIAAKGAIK